MLPTCNMALSAANRFGFGFWGLKPSTNCLPSTRERLPTSSSLHERPMGAAHLMAKSYTDTCAAAHPHHHLASLASVSLGYSCLLLCQLLTRTMNILTPTGQSSLPSLKTLRVAACLWLRHWATDLKGCLFNNSMRSIWRTYIYIFSRRFWGFSQY